MEDIPPHFSTKGGHVVEDGPRLRADARRNRQQIVSAARRVFLEHGADAPLEEVARQAGVGIATLYRRFPDRHTLIREVALENMAIVDSEIDRATTEHSGAWDALAQLVRRLVEQRVGAFTPILGPALEPDMRGAGGTLKASRGALFDRLEGLIDDARREGTLRRGITPIDIMVGVITLARPLPVLGPELNSRIRDQQLELFLGGLHAVQLDDSEPLRQDRLTVEELDRYLSTTDR